jgi:hypothetical protein
MMVIGPWGGSWRNVRRGTTFWGRDRSRQRWRHKGKVDNEIPVVGHRRPARRPHWSVTLAGLCLPALGVGLLGLWALQRAVDFGRWHLGNGVETALWVGATIAMMARSLSAGAPLWIRLVAFAVSVPYPVALVMVDFFGPL